MDQLSESQILSGISEVLYGDFGITAHIEANTNIIELVNNDDQFSEYDFMDVLRSLEVFFHFSCVIVYRPLGNLRMTAQEEYIRQYDRKCSVG